jgi:uncharacterized protein
LAIGEAIVTVMSEKGAPTPVAWTRLRAPQGSMDPSPPAAVAAAVAASPLQAKYGTVSDPESAREILSKKLDAAAAAAHEHAADVNEEYERMRRDVEKTRPSKTTPKRRPPERAANPIADFLGSRQGRAIVNSVVKGIFGTLRRR